MVEGETSKPKRSLFTKSAFLPDSKPASATDDIFHRSQQSYADIRAEQAAKYRLKQQKREEAARREAAAKDRESKRRRVSREDEELESSLHNDSASSGAVKLDTSPRKGRKSGESKTTPTATAESPAHGDCTPKVSETKSVPRLTETIELDDDDDDDKVMIVGATERKSETVGEDFSDDAESDPEIRELKRSIRERTRLREMNASSSTALADTVSRATETTGTVKPSTPSQPVFDPPINILITSRIPDTKPLIVKRKWTQRLQEIREKYCEINNLPLSSVFFTWRNRKLFDVTTCKALGVKVDGEGLPVLRNTMDGLTEDGSKIHIEAVTEEIFAENKQLAEQKYKVLFEPPAEEDVAPVEEPPKEEKQQVRLILKAKDYDPWKAKVNLDHNFSRITTAFRKQFRVPEDKDIRLFYDGDLLEPEGLVRDVDFEDQDTVEVHIK